MAVTSEELQRRVDRLDADMAKLIADNQVPGDFDAACAGRADEIIDNVSPADDGGTYAEIDRILEKYDVWHPRQTTILGAKMRTDRRETVRRPV